MDTTVIVEGSIAPEDHQPRILVIDAHELIASSLAVALKHAGFKAVVTANPDTVMRDGADVCLGSTAGDIALIGLLYGDGRTTLPLLSPLTQRGCRVVVRPHRAAPRR
jgi:DNA-binding NarL/FixJ family response regulator